MDLSHLRQRLLGAVAASAVLGLPAAAFVIYIAWQHNPGGAFHGDAYVNWGFLFLYGFTYYCVAGGQSAQRRWKHAEI